MVRHIAGGTRPPAPRGQGGPLMSQLLYRPATLARALYAALKEKNRG